MPNWILSRVWLLKGRSGCDIPLKDLCLVFKDLTVQMLRDKNDGLYLSSKTHLGDLNLAHQRVQQQLSFGVSGNTNDGHLNLILLTTVN